jgi:hypothetical protein
MDVCGGDRRSFVSLRHSGFALGVIVGGMDADNSHSVAVTVTGLRHFSLIVLGKSRKEKKQ